MEFPQKLQELMDAQNLSLREVAERIARGGRIAPSYQKIRRWLHGQSEPSLGAGLELSRVFDVPLRYLADPGSGPLTAEGRRRERIMELVAELGDVEALARLELAHVRVSALTAAPTAEQRAGVAPRGRERPRGATPAPA